VVTHVECPDVKVVDLFDPSYLFVNLTVTSFKSARILLVSMPFGVPSMNTLIQSIRIGIVVNRTIAENTNVQIGSIMYQFGRNIITMAAITTPTDCSKSPITWTKAARMFRFSNCVIRI
jgi:hypothetical protein